MYTDSIVRVKKIVKKARKDSGRVNFKSIVRADGVTKKYAFDEDGKMLYGWIDEQGERQTGDGRGQGYNGIEDGVIYEKGKRIEADQDEKLKKVEWNDPDDDSKDGTYLVNTSGKTQKKKTNVKDGDDTYYCTDSKGMVTYEGTEKYSAK